jgi:hypothetical protein
MTPPTSFDAVGRPRTTPACRTCGREVAPMRSAPRISATRTWRRRRRCRFRIGVPAPPIIGRCQRPTAGGISSRSANRHSRLRHCDAGNVPSRPGQPTHDPAAHAQDRRPRRLDSLGGTTAGAPRRTWAPWATRRRLFHFLPGDGRDLGPVAARRVVPFQSRRSPGAADRPRVRPPLSRRRGVADRAAGPRDTGWPIRPYDGPPGGEQ